MIIIHKMCPNLEFHFFPSGRHWSKKKFQIRGPNFSTPSLRCNVVKLEIEGI